MYKTTHLRIYDFLYFSFHQIDLVLDGNYYCSLKKSSVRAPIHLCDTLLISVVL